MPLRYADPQLCPDCRSPITGPTRCPACGLNLSGPVAVELFTTLQHADALLARLRAEPAAEPRSTAAQAAAQAPAPTPAPRPPVAPTVRPRQPRRVWTVPMVLLTLGAVLLSIGALLFLAVAWAAVGVGGRTVMLAAFTGAGAVGTVLATRRGLRGAAESLAGITTALAATVCGGAQIAGWLGEVESHAVIGSGLALAALSMAGTAVLARRTGTRLLAPQLLGGAALDIAAVTALVALTDHSVTAAAVALAGAGFAVVGRSTGQRAARLNATLLAGLGWVVLAGIGLTRTLGHLPTYDLLDVGPLLAAGALAGVLVPSSSLSAAVPTRLRVAGGVAAVWLVGLAATAWALRTPAAVSVDLAAVALLAAVAARLVGARRDDVHGGVLRWTALSVTTLAVLIAALWVAGLGAAALQAVNAVLTGQAGRSWDTRYALADLDDDLSPLIPLLAALAIAATASVHGLLGRAVRVLPMPSRAAIAVVALAPLLLGYVDLLVLVVACAALIALLEVAAAVRAGHATPHWIAAVGAGAVAGALSTYHPGPATTVAALAALVATTQLRWARGDAFPAALLAPPLVATTAGCATWWADAGERPTGILVVALTLSVSLSAVVLGWARAALGDVLVRTTLHASTLGTALAATALWPADADTTGLLVTLIAAAGLVVAVHERQPLAAVGLVVLLAAGWIAFGAEVAALPEPYAVPFAAAVLAHGLWLRLRDRSLGWSLALLPGVMAGLVPAAGVALADPVTVRGLVVALAATVLAVVLLRLGDGPLLLSAAVAAPVTAAAALHVGGELLALEPGWVGLATIAGVLALALAAGPLHGARFADGERWVLHALSLAVCGAVLTDAASAGWLAVDLTVLSAATAVVAIDEGSSRIAALGSLFGLAALWVRLSDTDVTTPEAYTLPLAAVVLAFGAWTLWRRATTRTFPTIGPGLALGLVPSFALAVDAPYTLRGLLVALSCLALVGVGAWRRWQAPFALGAGLGLVLVLLGLEPYLHHTSPTLLAVGSGAALLAAGINWERLARAGRTSWAQVAALR